MKDAYSFHTSQEDLEQYYEKCHAAYERIFERVGVPEDIPYTPKLLAATFMGSFDKDPADRFPALLEGKENTLVTERAIAAAVPEEFVTALVSKTLSEMPIL